MYNSSSNDDADSVLFGGQQNSFSHSVAEPVYAPNPYINNSAPVKQQAPRSMPVQQYQPQQQQQQQYQPPQSFSAPAPDLDFFSSPTISSYDQSSNNPYSNQGSMNGGKISGQIRSNSGGSVSRIGFEEEEAPLLEELGIDFADIWSRTIAVLAPTSQKSNHLMEGADLAGPMIYCLALGFCLLLTGKVHFGYIYGFGIIGCLLMYFILNLMGDKHLSIDLLVSILGYCLLPIVFLAGFNIFIDLRGFAGLFLSIVAIGWCTIHATKFLENAMSMTESRYLIGYPITLLYACFVLITIF